MRFSRLALQSLRRRFLPFWLGCTEVPGPFFFLSSNSYSSSFNSDFSNRATDQFIGFHLYSSQQPIGLSCYWWRNQTIFDKHHLISEQSCIAFDCPTPVPVPISIHRGPFGTSAQGGCCWGFFCLSLSIARGFWQMKLLWRRKMRLHWNYLWVRLGYKIWPLKYSLLNKGYGT